jgi:lipoprotein-anchoring transpeptidase ErfK/SrfK
MKTRSVLLVMASASLPFFGQAAHAGIFSQDSKHADIREAQVPPKLDPAKFVWLCSDASARVVNYIIVSLPDQRLYAYNGLQLVAWSSISSGRPGFETPVGTFTVSEKDVDHHSSLFDNAPMPYFMRLTDGGVGLHGGFLPGFAASHGCIRLPYDMAQQLFQMVQPGTSVDILNTSVIADVKKLKPSPTGARLADF